MPSRTGFGGHQPSMSPEMDNIAKRGLSCENAFSMGNPTEFALPGLFASSYLLDDGGIADGICKRPITLAETLRNRGYRTGAFFPIYRPYTHCYERGFDNFFYLYDPNVIGKNFNNTWRWYGSKKDSGELDAKDCVNEMVLTCAAYFDDLLKYCAVWQSPAYRGAIPASKIFDTFDFKALERNVMREKMAFEKGRSAYVMRMFEGEPLGPMPLIERAVSACLKRIPTSLVDIRFRGLLLGNLVATWRASSSYRSAKDVSALAAYRSLQGQQKWIKYPSARFVFETFRNWVTTSDTDRPFFAYLQFLDAHESNHYSFDIPGNFAEKNIEFNLIKQAFSKIREQPHYKGNVLYDTSIRYVDHVVQRLREFLDEQNLLQDTLLVITSDHGGSYPNIPIRDNSPHRVECFFDELYRIPLIFSGCGNSGSYSELVSSVDIAPTIISALGHSIPEGFKGIPIGEGQPRIHVTMESQGRGPSDLKRKPIRVCVRTKTTKLVYERTLVTRTNEGAVLELYDLRLDPEERFNLAATESAVERALPLIGVAKERLARILESSAL